MGSTTKVLACAFLLLVVAYAEAEPSAKSAPARLSTVGAFAFGGVGIAGITSSGEKDFRTILADSSALPQFEQVFAAGNLQAKAYALVGIRRLNRDRYNELSEPLRETTQQVTIFRGCIMSHEPFSSLLKSIDAGDYDARE